VLPSPRALRMPKVKDTPTHITRSFLIIEISLIGRQHPPLWPRSQKDFAVNPTIPDDGRPIKAGGGLEPLVPAGRGCLCRAGEQSRDRLAAQRLKVRAASSA